MSEKKAWDLKSRHSLEGAAEWIRKQSGALMVVVIRVDDAAIACDPGLAPNDAMERLLLDASALTAELNRQRQAAREKK